MPDDAPPTGTGEGSSPVPAHHLKDRPAPASPPHVTSDVPAPAVFRPSFWGSPLGKVGGKWAFKFPSLDLKGLPRKAK